LDPLSRTSIAHAVAGTSEEVRYDTGLELAMGTIECVATGEVEPSANSTMSAGIVTDAFDCPKLTVRIDTPSLPRVDAVDTRRLMRTDDS
jgi:hypothetical protein